VKATTLIQAAWRDYAKAYEEYHSACHNMRIVVKPARILYLAKRGWEINGRVWPMPAGDVVATLNQWTQEARYRTSNDCQPLPTVNEQWEPVTYLDGRFPSPEPISEE
jgi:uncharacterized protein YjlB